MGERERGVLGERGRVNNNNNNKSTYIAPNQSRKWEVSDITQYVDYIYEAW